MDNRPEVTPARPRGSLLLAALGFGFSAWFLSVGLQWPHLSQEFGWDEVDYVSAARLGIMANAFDQGSLTFPEFIRFASTKWRGQTPVLPAGYDEEKDPVLLRHFHTPLVFYLLKAVSGSESELAWRSVLVLAAAGLVAAALFCYFCSSETPGWFGALAVSVLSLCLMPSSMETLQMVSWEGVWGTLSAGLLSLWLRDPRPGRVGLALCLTLALTFLALDIGWIFWLGAALAVLLRWRKSPDKAPWRLLARGAALTTLVFIALWPACLLKASYLYIVLNRLYIVLRAEIVVKNAPKYIPYTVPMLPIFVPAILMTLWLWFKRRDDFARWGPFAAMGWLYALFALVNIGGRYYWIPAAAPLICLAVEALEAVSRRLGRALPAAFLAGTAVLALTQERILPPDVAIADIRRLGPLLSERRALVDGGTIYRHYLGAHDRILPITVQYDGRLDVREAGRYRRISRQELAGSVVVIRNVRWYFFNTPKAVQFLSGCTPRTGISVVEYHCPADLDAGKKLH